MDVVIDCLNGYSANFIASAFALSSDADGAQVYTASEILFAKLHEELKKLQDWVALGTVDLDSFVDERLHEVSDWELNFKYLKVDKTVVAEGYRNLVARCCEACSLIP